MVVYFHIMKILLIIGFGCLSIVQRFIDFVGNLITMPGFRGTFAHEVPLSMRVFPSDDRAEYASGRGAAAQLELAGVITNPPPDRTRWSIADISASNGFDCTRACVCAGVFERRVCVGSGWRWMIISLSE
jgi:hypothetical protein